MSFQLALDFVKFSLCLWPNMYISEQDTKFYPRVTRCNHLDAYQSSVTNNLKQDRETEPDLDDKEILENIQPETRQTIVINSMLECFLKG